MQKSSYLELGILITTNEIDILEKLGIQSAIEAGFQVHVFSFSPVVGLPETVTVRDAQDVISKADFLSLGNGKISEQAVARFSYLLLEKHPGMIWSKPDVYWRYPPKPTAGYLVGWEGTKQINGAVLALPAESLALAELIKLTSDPHCLLPWSDAGEPLHISKLPRGSWGPTALTHFLQQSDEEQHALPSKALFPITFKDRELMLKPKWDSSSMVTADTLAVQLVAKRLSTMIAKQKNGVPHVTSMIGKLLVKHGLQKKPVVTDAAPAILVGNETPENLPEIASLWIGGKLSWLEQLCLKSFADMGHHTTLYSYDPIDNVPEGVHTADAADIYPATPMLRHVRTGSPAIHADMWRLHLLKKTNKIWVDADMYCARPFETNDGYLYGWEKPGLVCNAVLGLPQNSPTLNGLLEFFKDEYAIAPWLHPLQITELEAERDAGRPVHITEQNWGFTGPASVTYFLEKTGEIERAKSEAAFYPVSFPNRNHMILTRHRKEVQEKITDETMGVHFWARRMKPRLQEKEGNTPRKNSFMDELIKRHNIDPAAAVIPAKHRADSSPEEIVKLQKEVVRLADEEGYSVDKICRVLLCEKQFVKQTIKSAK